jgi:hypothetical protein
MEFIRELDGFFRRIQIDVETRRREDRSLNVFNGNFRIVPLEV